MEFVVDEPESDQSVYVEQIDHGKLARICSASFAAQDRVGDRTESRSKSCLLKMCSELHFKDF
jgi:hypothetical protein